MLCWFFYEFSSPLSNYNLLGPLIKDLVFKQDLKNYDSQVFFLFCIPQATLAFGSWAKWASSTASEIWKSSLQQTSQWKRRNFVRYYFWNAKQNKFLDNTITECSFVTQIDIVTDCWLDGFVDQKHSHLRSVISIQVIKLATWKIYEGQLDLSTEIRFQLNPHILLFFNLCSVFTAGVGYFWWQKMRNSEICLTFTDQLIWFYISYLEKWLYHLVSRRVTRRFDRHRILSTSKQ